ncbi:hypothetical protein AOLI_G00119310 [Acnodon oligacanthus]
MVQLEYERFSGSKNRTGSFIMTSSSAALYLLQDPASPSFYDFDDGGIRTSTSDPHEAAASPGSVHQRQQAWLTAGHRSGYRRLYLGDMYACGEPPLASFLLRDAAVIEKDGPGQRGDAQSSLPQPNLFPQLRRSCVISEMMSVPQNSICERLMFPAVPSLLSLTPASPRFGLIVPNLRRETQRA